MPSNRFEWNLIVKGNYEFVIFDYDGTLAKIPVDWFQAREGYRNFASVKWPSLEFNDSDRLEEMELHTLHAFSTATEEVFAFRDSIESITNG